MRQMAVHTDLIKAHQLLALEARLVVFPLAGICTLVMNTTRPEECFDRVVILLGRIFTAIGNHPAVQGVMPKLTTRGAR